MLQVYREKGCPERAVRKRHCRLAQITHFSSWWELKAQNVEFSTVPGTQRSLRSQISGSFSRPLKSPGAENIIPDSGSG